MPPAAAGGFGNANKKYGELSPSGKGRRNAAKSAIVRKANARGRQTPKRRDRQLAIAHAYPVRLSSYLKFRRRFNQLAELENRFVSERGLETAWREYMACARLYRLKGQGFRTTNGQRARAHALSGRPRCERTIQRTHHRLAAMGLLRRSHIKKLKDRAGHKDCLEITITFVAPRSAAPAGLRPAAGANAVGIQNSPENPRGPPDQNELAAPDGAGDRNSGEQNEGAERPDRVQGEPHVRKTPQQAADAAEKRQSLSLDEVRQRLAAKGFRRDVP